MAISAAFESTCSACGDPIEEGDPIVSSDDEWVHEDCADDDEDNGTELKGSMWER